MPSTGQKARILRGQHPRIYWPPQGSSFLTGPLGEARVRGYLCVGNWRLAVPLPSLRHLLEPLGPHPTPTQQRGWVRVVMGVFFLAPSSGY